MERLKKENIIFSSKSCRFILIHLYNHHNKKDYVVGISKGISVCYSDIILKLKSLREAGIVLALPIKKRKECKGKQRRYHELTDLGKEITKNLMKINELMEGK